MFRIAFTDHKHVIVEMLVNFFLSITAVAPAPFYKSV